jgi:Flp pilus assembly protein TadG
MARDTAGAAAVEFVLWLAILILPVLNAVDIAFYTYQGMQLNSAAQAAVQAAWHVCDKPATMLPAVKNCSAGIAAMTTAAQSSTSLGATVTLAAPTEGYYCLNASGKLTLVSSLGHVGAPPSTPPATCTATNAADTTAPRDYITATASYSYTPIFTGVSVASLLTTPITRTAWMRLN